METVSELPDRLCIETGSRFFSTSVSLVGVRVNGEEQKDIIEYCVTGKWVRVGKRTLTGELVREGANRRVFETEMKRGVEVEPYWRIQPSRQVRRQMQREMSR